MLGNHAIVSQQAYLCGATFDYEDPAFPLVAFPISVLRIHDRAEGEGVGEVDGIRPDE